jgi:hypothetical protein
MAALSITPSHRVLTQFLSLFLQYSQAKFLLLVEVRVVVATLVEELVVSSILQL